MLKENNDNLGKMVASCRAKKKKSKSTEESMAVDVVTVDAFLSVCLQIITRKHL